MSLLQPSDNLKGGLYMLLAMASFAIGDAVIKSLSSQIPLGQILFVRGSIAFCILFLFAYFTHKLRPVSTLLQPFMLLRTLGELVATYFFLTALFNMPIANATALLQVLPLTVSVGAAIFFGETIGYRRMTAIIVGLIGVMFIIQPGLDGFTSYSIYCLVAVAGSTLRDLSTRRLPDTVPSLYVTLVTIGVVSVFGFLLGFFEDWITLKPEDHLTLSLAAVFVIGGFLGIVSSMRVGEVGFVTPFRYSVLLFSIILGIAVFDEYPNTLMIIGSCIVVLSGTYTLYREQRARRQEQQ